MGKGLLIKNVDFSNVAVDQVEITIPPEPVPCESVSLSPSSLTFTTVGQSQQVTATLTPVDTTDTLTWSSSNTNVATVANGLVTIHGIGTAIITAMCGTKTATITITQSTLRAPYALKVLANYIPGSIAAGSDMILAVNYQDGQQAVGQGYHADNTDLHVQNGAGHDIECIRVPYGATKAKVATSDSQRVTISYAYTVDTGSLITFQGDDYPEYLTSTTFVNTDEGVTVAYGQAIVFRTVSPQAETLSYVYFT